MAPLWASLQVYGRIQGPFCVIFSKYKIRTQWSLQDHQFSNHMDRALGSQSVLTIVPQGMLMLHQGTGWDWVALFPSEHGREALELADLGFKSTRSLVILGKPLLPGPSPFLSFERL
jgi:hypothetical protein